MNLLLFRLHRILTSAFLFGITNVSQAQAIQTLDVTKVTEDANNTRFHAVEVSDFGIHVFDTTEGGEDRTTIQSVPDPGSEILNYRVRLTHTATDADGTGNMFFLEIGDGLHQFVRLSINRIGGSDRIGRSDGEPTQISNPQQLINGTEYEVSIFANLSGETQAYLDPAGSTQFLDNNTYDVWLGAVSGEMNQIVDGQVAESAAVSSLSQVRYRMRAVARIQYSTVWSPVSLIQGVLTADSETVIGPFHVDIHFGAEVTGLEVSDFIVTNGAISPASLVGDGASYSLEITPTNTGVVTVQLSADSVSAVAAETQLNPASNILSLIYLAPGSDQPIATLTTPSTIVTEDFEVEISFTEPVTGLALDDFTIVNGSGSNLEGSGSAYSFKVSPTHEGEVTISLAANSVTDLDNDQLQNPVSETMLLHFEIPTQPSVSLYATSSTSFPSYELFISFSEEITGLSDDDFQVVNGVASGTISTSIDIHDTHLTPLKGRYYKTNIHALKPGLVEVTLPAGAVNAASGLMEPSLVSNILKTEVNSDMGEIWIIDDGASWMEATVESSGMDIGEGFAKPNEDTATFSSVVKRYSRKRQPRHLTFKQSPVWDHWNPVPNVGPSGAADAPVFLPIGPNDYYFLAKGSTSAYYAWHSQDMIGWSRPARVTEEGGDHGRWTTSAEYKDGKFYILYDGPNDEEPALYIDDDLMDGVVGEKIGTVFHDPSHGSDSSFFRDDEDGLFHIIYEDWSPIHAQSHSWDSPLAGHTSSPDGISGFLPHEHIPVVDHRTEPTGNIGTYTHPNGLYTYEIHEPAQDAYGDWTTIKIGSQYYLFSDYDQHDAGIRIARFTSDSIYKKFDLVGALGNGHPDPTVGFAQGQFYLITQQSTDYVSPGPWVDGVEARAGVDTDNDGVIDIWTEWQEVRETYDHKPGYARVVDLAPAELDLSGLPTGYGFQFEFRIDNTAVNNVSPILDRIELAFEPGNFQKWANLNDTEALPQGDHNQNGTPNLVEFVLGQESLPQLQVEEMTLEAPMAPEAREEGYQLEIWFSEDLENWKGIFEELPTGVSLISEPESETGKVLQKYKFADNLKRLFWRVWVSEP